MTFVIGFTDVKYNKILDKDAPACELDHLLADDLFLEVVQIIGGVFYDKYIPGANGSHPHRELKHDNPRLLQVKESLDQYLDGYTPKDTDRDGKYRRERPEGHLKYAAHQLREIVQYSMNQHRNIQVN